MKKIFVSLLAVLMTLTVLIPCTLSVNAGFFWLLLAALSLSIYNLLQRKLTKTYTALQENKLPVVLSVLGVICAVLSIIGIALKFYFAAALLIPCAVLIAIAVAQGTKSKTQAQSLISRYGSSDPERWKRLAQEHNRIQKDYLSQSRQWQTDREHLLQRQAALQEKAKAFHQYGTAQDGVDYVRKCLRNLDALDSARREALRSENHFKTNCNNDNRKTQFPKQ